MRENLLVSASRARRTAVLLLGIESCGSFAGCVTMSRCFPYPPPGYEPRPRREHKDLLKKERHKGKKHRREKGERKGKARRKGKDRDHKKLKREKRRERRKNKDRDKDNHQSLEQETNNAGDFDNRSPEGRRKHEAVKDVKCLDQLVVQFPGQGVHQNHSVNCASAWTDPGSSKGSGAIASKEKDKSFRRPVKKSGHASQHYHGKIQKNNNNAYTNKKGTDAGVGSQTRIKNGRNLQVGSGEKYSSRRHIRKAKQMRRSGDVNEQNKVDDLKHLACLDEQKFTCDKIKKRKELDANCTLHENGTKANKLSRTSPTNITYENGETSIHSQGIAPHPSTELDGTNTEEVDCHKPQDGYSNGIAVSCYLEQKKVSVSSSVYEGNKGYLKAHHPDTKYLSQLLSVPPSEDTSECIDQGWLLYEDRVEQNTATFEGAGSDQVWSDAQLMDTADVVALPYVVTL